VKDGSPDRIAIASHCRNGKQKWTVGKMGSGGASRNLSGKENQEKDGDGFGAPPSAPTAKDSLRKRGFFGMRRKKRPNRYVAI
jgi:hypothetical protein